MINQQNSESNSMFGSANTAFGGVGTTFGKSHTQNVPLFGGIAQQNSGFNVQQQ